MQVIIQKDVMCIRVLANRKDILIPTTLAKMIVILEHFALDLKIEKNHQVLLTARLICFLL